MKLSYILLLLIINFCFLPNVLAQAENPKKCPSVSSLQTIKIQESDLIEKEHGRSVCCDANGFPYWVEGKWGIHEYVSYFDTENKWGLGFPDFQTNRSEEALQHYNKALSSLTFDSGPTRNRGPMGGWSCYYRTMEGSTSASLQYG